MNTERVEVHFKKTHPDARLPTVSYWDPLTGDTGHDVYAVERQVIPAQKSIVVSLGLQVAYISPGYWIQWGPRSGMGFKSDVVCFMGVVDNGYRGVFGLKLFNHSDNDYVVDKHDRVAQFVVHRLHTPEVKWSNIVTETVRQDGGFGHTGA